jgi:hypothetical protein
MTVNVNGKAIEVSVTIGTFSDIVDYMRRYEPHRKMTLTKYIDLVEDPDYVLDLVVDLIFYPHAIAERRKGLLPLLSYGECFEFMVKEKDQVHAIMEMVKDAMPKPTEEEEVKEVKKKSS